MERRAVAGWLAVAAAVALVVETAWAWTRFGAAVPVRGVAISAVFVAVHGGALVVAAWLVRTRRGRPVTTALSFLTVYALGNLPALVVELRWLLSSGGGAGPTPQLRLLLVTAAGAVAASVLVPALRREVTDAPGEARWLAAPAATLAGLAALAPVAVEAPFGTVRHWFWDSFAGGLWVGLAPVLFALVMLGVAVAVLRVRRWAFTVAVAAAVLVGGVLAVLEPLQPAVPGVDLPALGAGYVIHVAAVLLAAVAVVVARRRPVREHATV